MNEEYLWSKKGSDPEIERLESLLSEFRFEHGAAPVLVLEPVEETAGFFGKRLAWIFGIATPSFALALFAFWIFTGSTTGDLHVRASVSSDDVPVVHKELEAAMPITMPEPEDKTEPRGSTPRARPTRVKTIHRTRKTKADRTQSLMATLSSEEKYAYDRLMLALSIAGTKLKVVQDTIDQTGELEKRSLRNSK